MAIDAGFSEFDKSRIDTALQQKLFVLFDAVVVHPPTRVPTVLVAQIKVVMFRFKTKARNPGDQMFVFLVGTALTFVGFEFLA